MTLRGRLGALEEPRFRLLWLGQTASALGDSLIFVALPFAVLQVGGGAAGLGLVLAAFTLSRAVFIVVGGVWSDRLPRRLVMLTCDVIRAAVDVFTAVALLTGAMEPWMFVVTASIFGAATAFFGPASTGLVPHTISEGRLQQANALLGLSRSATSIFGPALSGLLVAATDPGWVYGIDAVSFVVSAGFLFALRLPRIEPSPRQRFLSDLGDGFREAWSRIWLRAGFLGAGVANVGIGVFAVLGPLIVQRELGGAAAYGLILTGGAIGGVAGGLLALRLRPRNPVPLCLVAWSLSSLPSLALLPPLPALAIAGANGLFVAGIAYGNTIWETLLQREIPPERLSRVSAFDWMVSLIFMPLGQALAGPLSDVVGVEPVLVAAALLVLVPCYGLLVLPAIRHGPKLGPTVSPGRVVVPGTGTGPGEPVGVDGD
jgi:MFS family permease